MNKIRKATTRGYETSFSVVEVRKWADGIKKFNADKPRRLVLRIKK